MRFPEKASRQTRRPLRPVAPSAISPASGNGNGHIQAALIGHLVDTAGRLERPQFEVRKHAILRELIPSPDTVTPGDGIKLGYPQSVGSMVCVPASFNAMMSGANSERSCA